jgi:hypothetical protein
MVGINHIATPHRATSATLVQMLTISFLKAVFPIPNKKTLSKVGHKQLRLKQTIIHHWKIRMAKAKFIQIRKKQRN